MLKVRPQRDRPKHQGWSEMFLLLLILCCLLPLLGGCNDKPTNPVQPSPPSIIVPPGTLPTTRPEAHRTDFLTLPGVRSTLLLPGQPHLLGSTLMTLQARGYTDIYLYVVNEGDFGGSVVFNWYEDPQGYREILDAAVRAGIRPVVWLAPDDAPSFHRNSASRLPALWRTFIPAIDDLVGSYVLGLEVNEYWSRAEQFALARALPTSKPVFVHFTSGRSESVSSYWSRIRTTGLLYQYDSQRANGVRRETREVVRMLARAGKVVVAGEFDDELSESVTRALGDVAMDNGAIGYGNGGTR